MAKLFTEEQATFIRENSDGKRDQELCDLLKKQFGVSVNWKQMANWRGNHNARSKTSLCGWKKGKKAGVDFSQQKEFRNSLPIGSEIESKGVVLIKIERGKWIPKHRYLWEKAHGPVPEKHVIIFADGNNRNFELENLMLITRKQLAILNRQKMLVEDESLRLSGIAYAKLTEKISDLSKVKKENS